MTQQLFIAPSTVLSRAQSPPAYEDAPADALSADDAPSLDTHSEAADPFTGDEDELEEDSIRVETHPNAGVPPKIYKFSEFNRNREQQYTPPLNERPWAPFHSRLDYEFAEVCLQASLNRTHIDRLIKLMIRCREDKPQDPFTFMKYADLDSSWHDAYNKVTPVSII